MPPSASSSASPSATSRRSSRTSRCSRATSPPPASPRSRPSAPPSATTRASRSPWPRCAWARRPASAPASRTRRTAPSASPTSTRCTSPRAVSGRGARSSAAKTRGPVSSDAPWPPVAPTRSGAISPRADAVRPPRRAPPWPPGQKRVTAFRAVGLLLPLTLGVIAWLGETRALSARGASWLGVILLQAGVVGLVEFLQPAALGASLDRPLVAVDARPWISLPQLAIFAFAAMLGAHVARSVRGRRPLPAGAVWALVASFLALDTAGSGGPADLHFATAGMLLALGTVLEAPPVVHRHEVTGLPASLELNKIIRRLPRPYALACVAIDEFRMFREEQGVEVANRMLRLVAKALTKIGGGGHVFYLLRDHEFVVVFPRKSVEAAARYLNAVRRAVEAASLDVSLAQPAKAGHKAIGVVKRTVAGTISAGVAEPQSCAADPFNVLREAELALARAQQTGMNRIVVQSRPDASTDVQAG